MTIRYAIHPGPVVSKVDGDVHFISAEVLMRLYGVKPHECVVIDDESHTKVACFERASKLRLAQDCGAVHLFPRYDGNYTLPHHD